LSAKPRNPVKYAATRVLIAVGAAAVFVVLWGTVAITATPSSEAKKPAATQEASQPAAAATVIEKDGWRWNGTEWVRIEQPTAVAVAPPQAPVQEVRVIERQPIYYYYQIVKDAPSAGTPPAGTTPVPGGKVVTKPAGGGVVTASQPAPSTPAPGEPPPPLPDGSSPFPDASLPPPPAAPPPANPPPASTPPPATPPPSPPPPATPPPPPSAPPPPPPAPTPAPPPKGTKGS